MPRHLDIKIVSAREYYGPHATGTVVLVDGTHSFHGTKKEAHQYYDRLIAVIRGNNPDSKIIVNSDHCLDHVCHADRDKNGNQQSAQL